MQAKFKSPYGVNYETENWLNFDQIKIHPGHSIYETSTHTSINTSTTIGTYNHLSMPFLLDNCDQSNAQSMVSVGGLGILRSDWPTITDLENAVKPLTKFAIKIGINGNDLSIVQRILESGKKQFLVMVEEQNADTNKMRGQIMALRKNFGNAIDIGVGYVHNPFTIFNLATAGANVFLLGETNTNTSVPLVNLTLMARRAINSAQSNSSIIVATTPVNTSKALACGADAVLIENWSAMDTEYFVNFNNILRKDMFFAGVNTINKLHNECSLIEVSK